MSRKQLLTELNKRKAARLATTATVNALRAELFDKQLAFLDDGSKYKAALCTRRAGKTSMWARYCTVEALRNERVLIRIWAISRLRAKQLLWEEFKYLAARHSIPIQTNETELTVRFANGSEIRLLGADKDKEVQKKRGDKTWMEVVLESQLFGPLLKGLVEDVADPCLMDERQRGGGTFCLEGTPGPVCAGYWYDVTGRDDGSTRWNSVGNKDGIGAGWSCHRWSVLDNPFMPHARTELSELKRRRRWGDDNPTYLREWRALWVNDLGALFYKFSEHRNLYDTSKVQPWGPGWEHTLGWDLGFRDDMALVVWGWHEDHDALYEAFSWKKPGALAHEVMDQIDALEVKGFNFVKKVADTGGGGKMYVEEVMSRYSQVFEAAKKTEKYEHVRLFNDALLTGHIKLRPGSLLVEEMSSLPTDPEWPDPEKPEKPPSEDPRFPNHCCFVAGTRVLTDRGEVPIEYIRVGDMLATRMGFKPVVRAWCTGTKPVIKRAGLEGTADHPIYTQRGWVRLDALADSDTVLYAWTSRDSLFGAERLGIDSQSPRDARTASTTSPVLVDGPGGCIALSTRRTTEPSQRSTTFTTLTATPSTTSPQTSLLSTEAHTSLSTAKKPGLRILTSWLLVWLQRGWQLLLGIARQLGVRGTGNTGRRPWPPVLVTPRTVGSVEALLKASLPRSSALRSAPIAGTPGRGVVLGRMTPPASVEIAAGASSPTSTVVSRIAAVYAISVAEQHEYFANGVLVSNCDSGLYAFRASFHYLYKDVKPKPAVGSADYNAELEAAIERKLEEPKDRVWWDPADDAFSSLDEI